MPMRSVSPWNTIASEALTAGCDKSIVDELIEHMSGGVFFTWVCAGPPVIALLRRASSILSLHVATKSSERKEDLNLCIRARCFL